MDKRQFAEDVINSVRSLSVISVLSTRMRFPKNMGGHAKGLCPFHNDRKIGSFDAADARGIWKCFSCDAGGDAIKFVSLFDGINYLESAFRLALEFRIISHSEYDEYFARKRYSDEQVRRIERRYAELDKKKWENSIADEDTLNAVFNEFINRSSLSSEHRKVLLEERCLTEEEIEEGRFFTFPTRRILDKFSESIKKMYGGKLDVLEKIPGFYYDKREQRFTFVTYKGIGIGIKNAEGKVVGIQIRRDQKIEDGKRYIWFSSSFADSDEKYAFGTSSGSPIDVVYPKEIRNTTVLITEGRFKALRIAKETGSIAISVQGVCSWHGIMKELERVSKSPTLKLSYWDKPFKASAILLAFDSDMNYKIQVFSQARKMSDFFEEHGYPVYYLNWDDELGKGIDDVFINGGRDSIMRYDKQAWDKAYDKMIENMLSEEGYTEARKVPEEVVRNHFKSQMEVVPLEKGKLSPKHERMREAKQRAV